MESTVQPDKKLMVATSITPNASRTGFMITPPPIPQIAPMMEAKKQIRKKTTNNIIIPHIFLFYSILAFF
ncbi:hypothetical protein BLAHAN_07239 [Blautia hansenii DSM 20583]|uniref:Uncharacterized protein n=1 Tax=Blautia hansenii DSM 20583 TaxID=537007 RepID=C9LCS8_BLAHA|nr:hypothetical protein BLAHAN_07239 [Blautia hansenii DSM 20583]